MDDYKGLYYKEKKEVRFFEAGAHFRYRDLVRELNSLISKKEEQTRYIPRPKTLNVFQNENDNISNMNNINSSLINKTNTYLIHKKNITYFHKSSISSERGNNDIKRNIKESCVRSNNLCKAITLRKQNNVIGKKIMFPNYSRNIRMKSVDYDSKLKWKNITEHQMNNDISSFSIIRNNNGAKSIENPNSNDYKYKKITINNDKKINLIPNLYLKKKTGDFHLRNPTRNRIDINYNSMSQRGISQSTIKKKMYINSTLGRNGLSFRKSIGGTVYYK